MALQQLLSRPKALVRVSDTRTAALTGFKWTYCKNVWHNGRFRSAHEIQSLLALSFTPRYCALGGGFRDGSNVYMGPAAGEKDGGPPGTSGGGTIFISDTPGMALVENLIPIPLSTSMKRKQKASSLNNRDRERFSRDLPRRLQSSVPGARSGPSISAIIDFDESFAVEHGFDASAMVLSLLADHIRDLALACARFGVMKHKDVVSSFEHHIGVYAVQRVLIAGQESDIPILDPCYPEYIELDVRLPE